MRKVSAPAPAVEGWDDWDAQSESEQHAAGTTRPAPGSAQSSSAFKESPPPAPRPPAYVAPPSTTGPSKAPAKPPAIVVALVRHRIVLSLVLLLLFGVVLTLLLSAQVFTGASQPTAPSSISSSAARGFSVSPSPVPARKARPGIEAWKDAAQPARATGGRAQLPDSMRQPPRGAEPLPASLDLPPSRPPVTGAEEGGDSGPSDSPSSKEEEKALPEAAGPAAVRSRLSREPAASPVAAAAAAAPLATSGFKTGLGGSGESGMLRRGDAASPAEPGLPASLRGGRAGGDAAPASPADIEARVTARFEARLAAELERLAVRVSEVELETRRAVARAATEPEAPAAASPAHDRRLKHLEDQLQGLKVLLERPDRLQTQAGGGGGPQQQQQQPGEDEDLKLQVEALREQVLTLQQQQKPAPRGGASETSALTPAFEGLQTVRAAVSELRAELRLLWDALANATAASRHASEETAAVRADHELVLAQVRALETTLQRSALLGGGDATGGQAGVEQIGSGHAPVHPPEGGIATSQERSATASSSHTMFDTAPAAPELPLNRAGLQSGAEASLPSSSVASGDSRLKAAAAPPAPEGAADFAAPPFPAAPPRLSAEPSLGLATPADPPASSAGAAFPPAAEPGATPAVPELGAGGTSGMAPPAAASDAASKRDPVASETAAVAGAAPSRGDATTVKPALPALTTEAGEQGTSPSADSAVASGDRAVTPADADSTESASLPPSLASSLRGGRAGVPTGDGDGAPLSDLLAVVSGGAMPTEATPLPPSRRGSLPRDSEVLEGGTAATGAAGAVAAKVPPPPTRPAPPALEPGQPEDASVSPQGTKTVPLAAGGVGKAGGRTNPLSTSATPMGGSGTSGSRFSNSGIAAGKLSVRRNGAGRGVKEPSTPAVASGGGASGGAKHRRSMFAAGLHSAGSAETPLARGLPASGGAQAPAVPVGNAPRPAKSSY